MQSAKRIAEDNFIFGRISRRLGEGKAAKRLPLSAEKLNWNRLNRAIYAAVSAPAFAKAMAWRARLWKTLRCGDRSLLRTSFDAWPPHLFAAKRDYDLFIVARKNYPAIFNPFDRDLINLGADLEAELLAFRHRLAVDDRELRRAIDRNGADEECARWNFTLIRPAAGDSSSRLPANRPEWATRPGICRKGRFIFHGDGDGFVGAKGGRACKDQDADDGENPVHRFSITVVAAMATC
jgi:hypothetical protein